MGTEEDGDGGAGGEVDVEGVNGARVCHRGQEGGTVVVRK